MEILGFEGTISVEYWSVVQTQPFCERRAWRHLRNQHFECYLPLVRNMRVQKQRKTFSVSALFSRYLFVKIVDSWHSIKGTVGVSNIILAHDGKPACVQEKIISDLRAREDSNGFVQLPEKEEFEIGQRVRVVGGKFAGQIGLYDGMTSRQRERVLLSLLGQSVPVELGISSHVEALALH